MSTCRQGVGHLLAFTASVLLVGLALSAVGKIWVPLSWWVVFRRCVSVAASLSLIFFLWRVHHRSIRSLGLGSWDAAGKGQLLRGVRLGCTTIALMAAIYVASGLCHLDLHEDPRRVWVTLTTFIPAALLIGVLEELIFRGYVLQQLLPCSTRLAVVGSSLAYALVHIRAVPVWPQSGFELVGLFLLGVVLSLATLTTKQLYLAIGLHASLAYWARVNKLLFAFPDPSWQWLVGTNRLVNGVVAWGVLIGLAWVVSRQRRVA